MKDEELAILYQKTGDPGYIEVLFERYEALLCGIALKFLGNAEDAKDILHGLFLNLMEQWQREPKEIKNLGGYLAQAIRNECLALLRKRSRQPQTEFLDEFLGGKSAQFVEFTDFVSQNNVLSSIEELERAMQKRLQELEECQRTCIELFFFEGKSYKEIVEETNYTLKQVKSYLQNGKRNLRKKLQADARGIPVSQSPFFIHGL